MRFSLSVAAGLLAVPMLSVASGACWTGIVETGWVQSVRLRTAITTIGKKQSQSAIEREKMGTGECLWRDIRINRNRGIFRKVPWLTVVSLCMCSFESEIKGLRRVVL